MKILDHGSVELIETWGSDERIVEAARMSTGKGFLGWGPLCPHCGAVVAGNREGIGMAYRCPEHGLVEAEHGDEKFLAFLYDNKHATPFEMAGAIVEVEAPILVFREWHRHRTQSYNEMSARYTPLPDVNYIPTVERLMLNSKTNKQAGRIAGAADMTEQNAEIYLDQLREAYAADERLYRLALAAGVPKELARVHLPVGRYSRMRASAVLRNWLAFLTLRMAPNAQWEIRQYANAVHDILAERFPRTMSLFDGERP